MATIKDIARLAGVSHGTVSNVLNKTGKVSLEKIKAVEKAAKELGYVYNVSAKGLKKGAFKRVSLIVPSFQINIYRDLYLGLQQSLHEAGYEISLYNTDDIPGNEIQLIEDLKMSSQSSIVVVSCLKDTSYYDFFNIPVIFVNRSNLNDHINHYFISFDFKKAGIEIGSFINKNEYKNIAYFTSSRQYKDSKEFIDCLKSNLQNDASIRSFSSDVNLAVKKAFDILESEKFDLIITSDSERAEAILTASRFSDDYKTPILTLDSFRTFSSNHYKSYEMNYKYMGLYIANSIRNFAEAEGKMEKEKILSNQYFRFSHQASKKTKDKVLKMLTLISPSSEALKNLAPEFEKSTGIRLQITALPYDDLHNHISLLNREYYFDLVRMDVAILKEFGEDIYQEIIETEELNNILKFLENDCLKFFTRIKNQVYALPFDPSVQILLYRKDLFDDAFLQRAYYELNREELTIPKDFEKYNKVAKFFTKKFNKKSPTEYGSTINFGSPVVAACDFLPRFLYETEGVIQNKNGDLKHDELKESLENYLETFEYSIKENNSWWRDSTQEFAKGNAAMAIVFSNHASYIADSKLSEVAGRVGGALIPGSNPLLGGGVIGISKHSPQVHECMEFFKWFYNTDITSALTLLGGSSPNFKEVEDFDLLSIYPWISVISESFNLGTRSLTQDATKEMTLSQFENIIGSAVRNIVNKNMNIEEAMRFIEIMYSSN